MGNSRISYYYIGDSWNEFAKHIDNNYLKFNGAGLEKIWDSSRKSRSLADITVFSIPCMVRSVQFMKGGYNNVHNNTYFWSKKFYDYMISDSNFLDEFLSYYCGLLTKYYEEQKNLVYFIFNTGGFPYRHPYNMEYHGVKDFEQTMLDWFEDSGMRYTYLNLQGQKGMCRKEEDVPNEAFVERYGREYLYKTLGWNIPACYHDIDIYPKNTLILDHHPSEQAQKIGAQHIQDYIENILLQKKGYRNFDGFILS